MSQLCFHIADSVEVRDGPKRDIDVITIRLKSRG
jgi:hypothetical protein